MSKGIWALGWLLAAVLAFQFWHRTGDLMWTLAASAFAVASIRETLLLIKEVKRQ